MMDKRRATQIIKQNAKTCFRIMSIFGKGPSTARNVYEILSKQGMKDGPNLLNQYVTALHVAGKLSYVDKGVYQLAGDDIPVQRVDTTLASVMDEAIKEQMDAMRSPVKEEPVIEDKEPEEVSMNFNDMSPDEILKMSAKLAEIAAKKQKEIDPELLRKLLLSCEQTASVGDMLVEAIDDLRKNMTIVRKAMGMPTEK